MKKNSQGTSIDEIMEKHGFGAGSSGGGCEWYTKPITYKGKKAFVAITDDGGLSLPESLEEPIYVGIYDIDSGDELEEAKKFSSLKFYLDTLID
ncbi:MAG: hypothetical protein OS130_02355 [Thermodesulfobacteriota bacterium]|nr:MAG: hypothetical protein OS130_02355 [Thermodesulfobacteriota bacterium]